MAHDSGVNELVNDDIVADYLGSFHKTPVQRYVFSFRTIPEFGFLASDKDFFDRQVQLVCQSCNTANKLFSSQFPIPLFLNR